MDPRASGLELDLFPVTNKTDGSDTGLIWTFNDPDTYMIAQFTDCSANSSGHLEPWVIEMNRIETQSAAVLAHEFGHAISLNDLYVSKSSDKLILAARPQAPHYRISGGLRL